MTNIQDLIKQLLKCGVEVTLELSEDDNIIYNLNTRAKSDLKVELKGETLHCYMRYGEKETISLDQGLWVVIEDLARQVKYCMHGRDCVDGNWLKIMEHLNVIKIVTETKTKIVF